MEHASKKLEGMTVVESWIVEDLVHDKSKKYGLDMPIGTWMVSMKVDNDEIWNNYVKKNKIKGCKSKVWLVEAHEGDRLNFKAISDAAIVSGLIALLLRIYSGRHPQDILDTPPNFVTELKLEQHLSATRSNGLSAMLKAIRRFATEALQAT